MDFRPIYLGEPFRAPNRNERLEVVLYGQCVESRLSRAGGEYRALTDLMLDKLRAKATT